jgi:hypothetical protein
MRIPFLSPRTVATESRPGEINLLAPELWDHVCESVQRELLRQAELMVAASVTVSIGTDSRIATTMSVLGGGGIALLAAATSLFINRPGDWLLICAAAICATGLLTAAIICAFAIAPTEFLFPGVSPQHMVLADTADNQNLLSDENRFRPALLYSAQRAISNNKARAIVVAARYARALCIAGAGVMAGTGFVIFWAANRIPAFF